jgi:hypothetical protein
VEDLLRSADGDFVSDAVHAGHPTYSGLSRRLLVGPFDDPVQRYQATIHFCSHSVTRDRQIPMKSICDFDAKVRHGAHSLNQQSASCRFCSATKPVYLLAPNLRTRHDAAASRMAKGMIGAIVQSAFRLNLARPTLAGDRFLPLKPLMVRTLRPAESKRFARMVLLAATRRAYQRPSHCSTALAWLGPGRDPGSDEGRGG